MRLPGICIVCRNPVLWNGRYWKDRSRGMGRRHVCPQDRPTCGAWMRNAKERCARSPGHGFEHRTRWAMDNQRRMSSGRAA